MQTDRRAGSPLITDRTIRLVSTQLEEHRNRWNRYDEIWNSTLSGTYPFPLFRIFKSAIFSFQLSIFAVGPMIQQLAALTCEIGVNLVPWIWSRSSLAFHRSLLRLIPGSSNDLGKSTSKSYSITDDLHQIVPCVRQKMLLLFLPLPAHICDIFPLVRTGRDRNLGFTL